MRCRSAWHEGEVVQKYRAMMVNSEKLEDIDDLRGHALLCHCRRDQSCRVGALLDISRASGGRRPQGPPAKRARIPRKEFEDFGRGGRQNDDAHLDYIEDGLAVRGTGGEGVGWPGEAIPAPAGGYTSIQDGIDPRGTSST